jgi:hypothetical protein
LGISAKVESLRTKKRLPVGMDADGTLLILYIT